jgi:hypothetical protein
MAVLRIQTRKIASIRLVGLSAMLGGILIM